MRNIFQVIKQAAETDNVQWPCEACPVHLFFWRLNYKPAEACEQIKLI